MSDKTYLDEVTGDIPSYINKVLESVRNDIPRPPGVRKMSEAEQLEHYERLTPQDIVGIAQKHGIPATEKYIADMEQLKLRRAK